MRFRIHGYRHADYLFPNLEEYSSLWAEVSDALQAITDDMIIEEFEKQARRAKSISEAINRLIKKELVERGWAAESYIFADEEYRQSAQGKKTSKGIWRLDFAKDQLCIEVAFNHRSDISWNLIKPTLASELNHVEKAIQTSGGVLITATQAMKAAGGFDNAVGTFEDYVQYLKPMAGMLPAPLMIVGLEEPETFTISQLPTGVGNNRMGAVNQRIIENLDGLKACPRCGSIVDDEAVICPACERRFWMAES